MPYWSAMIRLVEGIPIGVEWDDGCLSCGEDCVDETCAELIEDPSTQCSYGGVITGEQKDCRLRVSTQVPARET